MSGQSSPEPTNKCARFGAWLGSHWRRLIADLGALVVFGVAIWVGWLALGTPWSDGAHPRKLLYSGLVIVAAFLVAAMLQRAVMGDYAIEAGPFKIKAITREAIEAGAKVAGATETLVTGQRTLEEAVTKINLDVSEVSSASTAGLDEVQESVLTAVDNIKNLDERLGRLEELERSDSP